MILSELIHASHQLDYIKICSRHFLGNAIFIIFIYIIFYTDQLKIYVYKTMD